MCFSGFCVVHSQTEENCLFGWAQAAVPSVYDLMVCWVGIWLLWPSSNSHWTGHCLRLFKQSLHGWVRFLNTYLLEFKYKQSDGGVAHSCPVINPSRIKLLRHQRFHVSTLRWVGYYSLIPVFLCLGTKTYQTPWSRNLVVVIPEMASDTQWVRLLGTDVLSKPFWEQMAIWIVDNNDLIKTFPTS